MIPSRRRSRTRARRRRTARAEAHPPRGRQASLVAIDLLARAVRRLGRRVGDRVALVEERLVGALAAEDRVRHAVAVGVDDVVAGTAVQAVAAARARQAVVAALAGDAVV